jgi:hypothetical protein
MTPLGMEGGCHEREMERDEVGTPITFCGGSDGAVSVSEIIIILRKKKQGQFTNRKNLTCFICLTGYTTGHSCTS